MEMNLEKLEEIFALKYEALQPEQATNSEWWIDYCDGQVDEIFDSIHDKYVEELEWMTEDEWQTISQNLYNMVHEGVF